MPFIDSAFDETDVLWIQGPTVWYQCSRSVRLAKLLQEADSPAPLLRLLDDQRFGDVTIRAGNKEFRVGAPSVINSSLMMFIECLW